MHAGVGVPGSSRGPGFGFFAEFFAGVARRDAWGIGNFSALQLARAWGGSKVDAKLVQSWREVVQSWSMGDQALSEFASPVLVPT
jgi:hypothetical protein